MISILFSLLFLVSLAILLRTAVRLNPEARCDTKKEAFSQIRSGELICQTSHRRVRGGEKTSQENKITRDMLAGEDDET